jgi:hypothetical protein
MTAFIRVIGITLLVCGMVAFGFGLNSSCGIAEQGLEKTTGRFSKGTMWYLLGGIAMMVGGGAIAVNAKSISSKW